MRPVPTRAQPSCCDKAKFYFLLAATLFGVSALFTTVRAQSDSDSATVEDIVTALDAKVVADAPVIVRNSETGYTHTLTTNERGQFIANIMPIGL